MSKIDIDQLDALYLAEHILRKLGLPYRSKNVEQVLKSHNSSTRAAIEKIEEIENDWSFTTDDQRHSFGRKYEGEIIKLWSVPQKSAKVVEALVALSGAKMVVEIGTSAGYAALYLAEGAKHNKGLVYTIELLKQKSALAREHFKLAKAKNIVLVEGEASQSLKEWNKGTIDFVFLDADKENYGKYLDLLLPLMKKNALIVADNINDYGHMMEDYLQRVTGTHLPNSRVDKRVRSYYLAALDNGLMITKKL